MKKLVYGVMAISAMMFVSCSTDHPENPGKPVVDEPVVENEAPTWDESVTVMIPKQSRASSSFLEENIDRFTATRVDIAYSKYALVSYHGRLQEQIGMVQIIDPSNYDVKSELVFPDSRVNYCAIRNLGGKMTAYVGIDQVSKKKKGVHYCGIVTIPMENNVFKLPGDEETAQIKPYYVDGVSVNCIKFIEQDKSSALIVASGGNVALGEDGKAGFTKFNINADPTVLETTDNNMLAANYRGYWVSHNIAKEGTVGLPVAYTYRTVENGDLVWKVAVVKNSGVANFFNPTEAFGTPDAEAEVMRKYNQNDDRSRFSVSMFLLNQGRFIVVSTGSKVLDSEVGEGEGGGVRVYRFDENGSNGQPELCLVDVWDKACNNTTNMKVDDKAYLFAACANGVFKCEIDYYEDGFKPGTKTPNRFVQLVPVEKRVTDVKTESDTFASTNYVQSNVGMKQVHVAGGYEGYYTLDLDDESFIPADPRKDLKEHN